MIAEPKRVEADVAAPDEDQPNLPLYIAGLIVTLSGILAVTMWVEDQNLTVTTLLLTVIGFIFSIGCRYLRVRLHIAEILLLGTAAYVLYNFASGQMDWHSLVGRSQMDIGTVFAWAMTAWSWALISDSLILISALLAMASIGLMASADINGPVETCFIVALLSSLFLMGQHLYLAKREMAPPEDRNRGAGQIWVTKLIVVLVSAVLVFATASVVVVPAEIAFKGLSLVQALQGLASFNPANKQSSGISGPNVSDDANLEIGTGQGWGATTDIVAFVQPSDKQPHYWKARTYDQYTGTGWTSTLDGQYEYFPGRPVSSGTVFDIAAPSNYNGEQTITAQFDVRGTTREFFYTGDLQSLTINRPSFQLQICTDGHTQLTDGSDVRSLYEVTSTAQPDSGSDDWAARLRKSDPSIPPPIAQMYAASIGNPITSNDDIAYFQNTVKSVIDALPPSRRDEFDEVQALTDYVAHRAVYTLDVAPLPAGSDHVRSFLQDTRSGYCDMFASSLAVLCRVAGFPSRVATGFAPGNFDGTRYSLRVMDKHAWTEVYFTGYGWVPFDATIGSAMASTPQAGQQKTSTLLSRIRSLLLTRGPVAPILIGAILLILGYIFKVEVLDGLLRRLRTKQGEPVSREELGRQYERMLKSIGHLGLPRKLSETPFEFAERATPYLEELTTTLRTPLDTETVKSFTKQYTVIRYGDDRLRQKSEPVVDPELAVFLRHAQRARVKRMLRRLRRPGSQTDIVSDVSAERAKPD